MYSMDELKAATGKTPQTLYRMMRENVELKGLLDGHSKRQGKRVYYDEAILEWFTTFYNIDTDERSGVVAANAVGGAILENGKPSILEDTAPRLDDKDKIIAELKADLERERAEKTALFQQVQELQKQNGNLLLLLSQEKQEKQALLPPPRTHKTIGARIRDFFGKKD